MDFGRIDTTDRDEEDIVFSSFEEVVVDDDDVDAEVKPHHPEPTSVNRILLDFREGEMPELVTVVGVGSGML